MPSGGIEDLPLLVVERVLDYLDTSSAWRLGSVSRHFHRLVLEEDGYWRRRARQKLRMQLAGLESSHKICALLQDPWRKPGVDGRALIHDPVLNGHKELLKIFTKKKSALPSDPAPRSIIKEGENKATTDLFALLQSLSLWEEFVTRDSKFRPANSHLKLALFGPGIESPKTKQLVHRIVQAHDSSLNAVDFVAGLPGGIGSGVRVQFKRKRIFDLVCLYTNSCRLREDHRGVERLLARHNRLHIREVSQDNEMEWLHENVLRVLPTLDVLLFAIDVTDFTEGGVKNPSNPYMIYIRRELDIMIKAAASKSICLVVLCCFSAKVECSYDLVDLANALALGFLQKPWAIFEVDIKDMKGFVNALQWAFYRSEKQRQQLKYHYSNAASSSQELHERLRSLW